MAKRELIDRNNLEITSIATDDYSGNEVIAAVLMEDVEKAPVVTEQDIIKPYLEAIEAEATKYSGTGEREIQAYGAGLWKAKEIIKKLLSEQED